MESFSVKFDLAVLKKELQQFRKVSMDKRVETGHTV